MSNISGEVSPRPLGQERVINLGPHTGADETGECEGSGGGCFLQKLQCGAWGLPWKQRPEGRKGVNPMDNWGKNFPGRGKDKVRGIKV